jgi:hypothetical protein
MKRIFGLRGRRLALAVVGIFALAAGIAYAAIPDAGTGVYHACMLKNVGTIRIIDPAKQQCSTVLETEITFNQKGQTGAPGTNGTNGTNGTSPTVQQLSAGDPNCAAGGAAITDAAGTTAYVCSGQDGTNGTNGTDGQSFDGTFTSLNGEYTLSVTNTGVHVSALNGAKIDFTDSAINVTSRGTTFVRSDGDFTVMGGTNVTLRAGSNLSLRGDSNATLQGSGTATVSAGGPLALSGSTVGINGGSACFPAVRVSDAIKDTDTTSGQQFVVALAPGSSTVCIG